MLNSPNPADHNQHLAKLVSTYPRRPSSSDVGVLRDQDAQAHSTNAPTAPQAQQPIESLDGGVNDTSSSPKQHRHARAHTSTEALGPHRCAPGPSQLWLNCAVAPPARATNPQRRLALLANKRGTSSQERPPYLDKSPGPRRCAPGPTEEIPLGEVSTGKSLHAAPTDSTRDTHDTLHGVANPRHPARPWIRTVQYMVPFLTIRSARLDVVPPRQCAGLPG